MQWLLDDVDARIAGLAPRLFTQLEGTTSRTQIIGWIHQLPHVSRGFIQALCSRVALCGRDNSIGLAFYGPFSEHLRSEIMHPVELEEWMRRFDLVGCPGQPEFCGVPATPQTRRLILHCWDVAESSPPDEQVVAMNVVAEGVAYRFFDLATRVVERLGMKFGRFWRAHGDDLAHARIGVPAVGYVESGSDRGRRLWAVADEALTLFDAALDSWASEAVSEHPDVRAKIEEGRDRETHDPLGCPSDLIAE